MGFTMLDSRSWHFCVIERGLNHSLAMQPQKMIHSQTWQPESLTDLNADLKFRALGTWMQPLLNAVYFVFYLCGRPQVKND